MDPVSALGIAAAVIQFTDFTGRLLSETWRFYRSPTGYSSEDFELKVVASDLEQLTTSLGSILEPNVPARNDGTDARLLMLCHESNIIAAELQGIVTEAVKRHERLQNPKKSLCSGDAFRTALSAFWNRKKVESVRRSLDFIHHRLLDTITTSIWHDLRDAKARELQFSNRLDHAIQALESAIAKSNQSGPQVGRIWSNSRTQSNVQRLESQISDTVQENHINNDVIQLIWDPHWDPDLTLLAEFPGNTSHTPGQIGRAIARTLLYETIDRRREAIPSNYESTYEWVFERIPKNVEGGPAWSSMPDWLETQGNGVYWLTGKPGSGKSTMMKFMLRSPRLKEHLRVWSEGSPLQVGHYYAWNPGEEMDKSKAGLKRSILHQIISANPSIAAVLCPRRWALFHATRTSLHFPEWREWELDESFTALLKHTKTSIYLFLLIDGLDEFNTAPESIIHLIRRIAAEPFIKICAASRPWPEFQDAFLGCPSLQMHRLTQNDIRTFANFRFSESPGFLEVADIYPEETKRLVDDIVVKSNGVFLWTAVVTKNLLQSLGEGAQLQQLRNILDQLPSDIEKLYAAILDTVPPRLLPEMAAMLLIFKVARHPLPWFTMWVADEFRDQRPDHISAINLCRLRQNTLPSLQRRLAARTRGLLEIAGPWGYQSIGYLHRTVAEWTQRPGVWEQISLKSSPGFDPYVCLFTAETLLLHPFLHVQCENLANLWTIATRALFYASLCRCPSANLSETQFLASLETFNTRLQAVALASSSGNSGTNFSWTCAAAPPGKMNNFLGLAAQFGIEPYVRVNVAKKFPNFQELLRPGFCGLLEQVVHGPREHIKPYALEYKVMNDPEKERRLRMVKFLIEHGVPVEPDLRQFASARATDGENFFSRPRRFNETGAAT